MERDENAGDVALMSASRCALGITAGVQFFGVGHGLLLKRFSRMKGWSQQTSERQLR